MHDQEKTRDQLLVELAALRQQVAECESSYDELERRVEERTAELVRVNEELTIFRRFVESSRQGFGMSRLNGEVTYVNPAISRVIADGRPEDVIGKHISTFHSKEYMHRREVEILPSVVREGHWQGEVAISYRGGTIQVLQNSFLVRDEHGEPAYFATVLTDITERKQAEEALRQTCDELQVIYDGMIDGLLVADLETKQCVRANAAMCRMLGYSEKELLSMTVRDIHPPEIVPSVLEKFRTQQDGQRLLTENRPILRKDGTVFYADISNTSLLYHGRRCIIGLFRDITERKRAQETLQREHRTLKHLLQSSDHERQLIAYEIHDGLAQQLAGAIMQFQTYVNQKQTKQKEAAKAFDAAMTMLHQGLCEARRLISGVRPPILDEEGVVAAVAHLVNEQSRRKGPTIEYRSRVEFARLAPILENAIYRIAQEGLANACQHSGSEKVRISLVQQEDRVQIEIRDWGVGFDTETVHENRYGLEGIRQRVRLLGGKCSIQSKAGRGARIALELPVVVRE